MKQRKKYQKSYYESRAILSKKYRFPFDLFVKKSNDVHNHKYVYEELKYFGIKKRVGIICPIHGEYWQLAEHHINGHGCKNCAIEKRKNLFTFSLDQILELFNKKHGDRYDYSLCKYDGYKNKIEIICPIHGLFKQRVADHINGHGCKQCSSIICYSSSIENEWLDSLNIDVKYRQKLIIKSNKTYNVDAYVPEINTIYEFYGDFWHGNPKMFDLNKIHPLLNKTYGYLYNKTINREEELIRDGYKLIHIWEHDFRELKRNENVKHPKIN